MQGRISMMSNETWSRPLHFSRAVSTLALTATAILLLCPPGGASAIRTLRSHAPSFRTEASLGSSWNHFLIGGPTLWEAVRPPRFPSHLVLSMRNGNLVETPFLDYLVWRRNLNSARFDLVHPVIGPALGQLAPPAPPVIPIAIPGGTTHGGGPGTSINPVLEVGVPEPTSISTGLVVIAVAYGWRRRRFIKS